MAISETTLYPSVNPTETALNTRVGTQTISYGAGAPTTAPAAIGDVYVDTENRVSYDAIGTASSADWIASTGGGSGDLIASNNLSDVDNAATARANLGLEIDADVQAYSSVLANTTASFTTAEKASLASLTDAATEVIRIDDYADVNTAFAALTEGAAIVGKGGTTYTAADGQITIGVKKYSILSDNGQPFTIDFSGNTLWYNDGLIKSEGALDATLNDVAIQSTLEKGEAVQITAATFADPHIVATTQYPHGFSAGDLVFIYTTASFPPEEAGQTAYLTMKDSDEGMALAIPVEVMASPAPTSTTFAYTPLYNGTPDANLTYNVSTVYTRKNDLWVDLTSTSGWTAGDLVLINSDDTVTGYTGSVTIEIGEENEIDFVEGGGLWLRRPVKNAYATNPVITLIDPVECFVDDLHIIGKGATASGTLAGNADCGFRLRYARKSNVSVSIADCDYMAMQIINCYDCDFPLLKTTMDKTNSGGALGGKIEYQYGIGIMNACNHLRFGKVICDGGRHGPDETCLGAFGPGRATDISFDHVECYNQWSNGFDSHAHAERWLVKYAKMQNNGGFGWRSHGITVLCLEAEYCDQAFLGYADLRDIYVDVHKAESCGYAGIRLYCDSASSPNPDNIDLRLRQLKNSQFGIRMELHNNHIARRVRIHEVNCENVFNYPVNLRDYTGSNTGFEYRGVYIGRINADATGTLLVGKNVSEGVFENFYAVEAKAGSGLATLTGTCDNNQFSKMYGTLTGGSAIGEVSIASGSGNLARGIVTSQTLTIASGAATIIWADVPFVYIDTEASAGTDDLDSLSGGRTGEVYYLRMFNSGRVPTLKDGTGNIQVGSDLALNSTRLIAPLLFTSSEYVLVGTPAAA